VIEKQIDALIAAGWQVLKTDFSESAFLEWRKQASGCLAALQRDDCAVMNGTPNPDTKASEVEARVAAAILNSAKLRLRASIAMSGYRGQLSDLVFAQDPKQSPTHVSEVIAPSDEPQAREPPTSVQDNSPSLCKGASACTDVF
jgi:hypothetical protein